VKTYVLDRNLTRTGGIIGELHLGGAGIAWVTGRPDHG
jgi:hypothetical protein